MTFSLTDFVPITVISAVLLFVLKEIIELIRKSKAKKRKKKAFRALIAEEIERNHWALRSLKSILGDIQSEHGEPNSETIFYIVFTKEGRPLFRYKRDPSEDFASGCPVPDVSRDRFNQLLTDIAENDEKLYELCRSAYDQVAELEHIRSSLIEHLSTEEDGRDWLLSGFVEYGIETLDDALPALEALYKECTNGPLKKAKLR